jgi:hypothetical protein
MQQQAAILRKQLQSRSDEKNRTTSKIKESGYSKQAEQTTKDLTSNLKASIQCGKKMKLCECRKGIRLPKPAWGIDSPQPLRNDKNLN